MAVHTLKFVKFMNRLEDRTLARAVLAWFNRNLSRQTVEKYECPVMNFLRYAEGKLKRQPRAKDINLRMINSWITWRDRQISRTTLAMEFSVLRHLFSSLSTGPEKIYQENPLAGAAVSKRNYYSRPTPVLNDNQIKKLAVWLESEKTRLAARKKWVSYRKARYDEILLSLFLTTGMSAASVSSLKIRDFNNEPGNYFLKEYRTKNRTYVEKKLFDRIGKLISDFLKEYRPRSAGDEFLFPSRERAQLSSGDLSNRVASVIARSGVTPHRISSHCLRATYAVQLFYKGLPLLAVKDRMGHRDISTTLIYLQLASTEGIDARLDPMSPESPAGFSDSVLNYPL